MNTFNHGWDYKPNQQKVCELVLSESNHHLVANDTVRIVIVIPTNFDRLSLLTLWVAWSLLQLRWMDFALLEEAVNGLRLHLRQMEAEWQILSTKYAWMQSGDESFLLPVWNSHNLTNKQAIYVMELNQQQAILHSATITLALTNCVSTCKRLPMVSSNPDTAFIL